MSRFPLILGTALLAGVASAALAAPYCTQAKNGARVCTYTDTEQCARRAGELNALCIANPTELRSTTGSARYCLVNNDHMANCVYTDRKACEVDATREGDAVCLDNVSGNH